MVVGVASGTGASRVVDLAVGDGSRLTGRSGRELKCVFAYQSLGA